jgi:hypothetical protein
MKRLILPAVVIVALIGAVTLAPGASAASQRQDAYYQVWCTTPTTPEGGDPVQAESVDAHSVQLAKTPGGKDGAVLNFVENHQGWNCWLVGPLNV